MLDVPISYTVIARGMGIRSVERQMPANINRKEPAINTMAIVFQIHDKGSRHHMCQLM